MYNVCVCVCVINTTYNVCVCVCVCVFLLSSLLLTQMGISLLYLKCLFVNNIKHILSLYVIIINFKIYFHSSRTLNICEFLFISYLLFKNRYISCGQNALIQCKIDFQSLWHLLNTGLDRKQFPQKLPMVKAAETILLTTFSLNPLFYFHHSVFSFPSKRQFLKYVQVTLHPSPQTLYLVKDIHD